MPDRSSITGLLEVWRRAAHASEVARLAADAALLAADEADRALLAARMVGEEHGLTLEAVHTATPRRGKAGHDTPDRAEPDAEHHAG